MNNLNKNKNLWTNLPIHSSLKLPMKKINLALEKNFTKHNNNIIFLFKNKKKENKYKMNPKLMNFK